MPFNGSGGFVPLPAPDYPAVAGTTIVADYYNNVLQDIFDGLGNTMTRDGQSPATANIPMGGFKLMNVGAPTATGDVLTWGNAAQVNLLSVVSAAATPAQVVIRAPSGQLARTAIASDGRDSSSQGFHLTQGVDGTGNIATIGSHALTFSTVSSEKARLTTDGKFGLGTASPIKQFDLASSGAAEACLRTGAGQQARLYLAGNGSGVGTNSLDIGQGSTGIAFIYQMSALDLDFGTSGTFRVRIPAAGGLQVNNNGVIPLDNGVQPLGGTTNRWGTVYGLYGNFTNGVNKADLATIADRARIAINLSGLGIGEVFLATSTVNLGTSSPGDVYYICNNSGSAISLTASGGVTMRLGGTTATGTRTLLPYGLVSALYLDSNTIVLSGSGLT